MTLTSCNWSALPNPGVITVGKNSKRSHIAPPPYEQLNIGPPLAPLPGPPPSGWWGRCFGGKIRVRASFYILTLLWTAVPRQFYRWGKRGSVQRFGCVKKLLELVVGEGMKRVQYQYTFAGRWGRWELKREDTPRPHKKLGNRRHSR